MIARLLLIFSLLFTASLLQSEETIPPAVLEKLQTYIKFDPEKQNQIGYISIDDHTQGISESTWLYVKKALDHYKQTKPIFVILNLNTPGGEVFAAQKISDALKDLDTQYNIPVVAYVNNWAISAGAMLAYSSRFIIITKDASMGAAEPILATETGETKTASEKINSAIRTDFANRASFFGRNPFIAEAMVDKDIILVKRHGKIIKLDMESQIKTTEPDPDIIISPKGKLLTLSAEQLIEYSVADIMVPPTKITSITETEKEAGKWPASKMPLFQQPFFNKIPNTVVDEYQMDWKTRFFVLLASPAVSSLLVLGLMIGFYMEISNPGFGIPGTIATLCLFFIILSYLSLQIANWLEVILLLTGLAIILIELFVLPTFGLLGFVGILFFIAGLFGILLPGLENFSFDYDSNTVNAAGEAILSRLAWFSGTMILGFIIMVILGRYFTPKAAAWSRLVLEGHEQEGYVAGIPAADLPKPGTKGIVFATLRPTGKVIINDTIYDAIAEGTFIEKDTPIVVSSIDGSNVVVDVDADLGKKI